MATGRERRDAGPGFARTQHYERRIVLTHVDAMQVRQQRRVLGRN